MSLTVMYYKRLLQYTLSVSVLFVGVGLVLMCLEVLFWSAAQITCTHFLRVCGYFLFFFFLSMCIAMSPNIFHVGVRDRELQPIARAPV